LSKGTNTAAIIVAVVIHSYTAEFAISMDLPVVSSKGKSAYATVVVAIILHCITLGCNGCQ
jgi:hypothetical protein